MLRLRLDEASRSGPRSVAAASFPGSMLPVTEEQLHVAVFELQCLGDLTLVHPGPHERRQPFDEGPETVGEIGLGSIAAMGPPRVAEVREVRLEPEFPAAVAEQLEEPLLEAPRDDPRHAAGRLVA